MKLNLGCGRNVLEGWTNLDCRALPGVNLVVDLTYEQIPLEDNSVDEILASHLIEHIQKPLSLLEELHRVAKPDSLLTIRCPYGSSDDAWEDPTHVRPYFLGSFGYFGQPFYWRADYGYRGDWQVEKVELVLLKRKFAAFGTREMLDAIMSHRNIVAEMVATLRAVKPIREPLRELQVAPEVRFSFR